MVKAYQHSSTVPFACLPSAIIIVTRSEDSFCSGVMKCLNVRVMGAAPPSHILQHKITIHNTTQDHNTHRYLE